MIQLLTDHLIFPSIVNKRFQLYFSWCCSHRVHTNQDSYFQIFSTLFSRYQEYRPLLWTPHLKSQLISSYLLIQFIFYLYHCFPFLHIASIFSFKFSWWKLSNLIVSHLVFRSYFHILSIPFVVLLKTFCCFFGFFQ